MPKVQVWFSELETLGVQAETIDKLIAAGHQFCEEVRALQTNGNHA